MTFTPRNKLFSDLIQIPRKARTAVEHALEQQNRKEVNDYGWIDAPAGSEAAHIIRKFGRANPAFKALRTIQLAPRRALLSKWYKWHLAKRLKALGLSALATSQLLALVIFSENIKILDADGKQIALSADIIFEAYGNSYEMGWNDDIKEFAEQYPDRRPQDREIMKYCLWDAFFKLIGQPITFED